MKNIRWIHLSLLLLFAGSSILAQTHTSPYAGEEARSIKSLSDARVKGYLSGAGMGFAKAAELNHYPGPKHVLELQGALELTPKQIEATKASMTRMKSVAVKLGANIVERERLLNEMFAEGGKSPSEIKMIVDEIAALEGELRFAHLNAHMEMVDILSEAQIRHYDQLRGYSNADHSKSKQMKH